MSALGNLVWLIFGGALAGLGYMIGGLLLCLTIVGIPFGLQSIRLGQAMLTPFGRRVVAVENQSPLKIVFDVIWIALFGWEIATVHLTFAAILAVTIVGIPFALQHLKLIPVALFPFNEHLE
jgi:uncharacterized membrane protein YccF (DUF307 family)